ncbi:ornithine carbamoyltransferase [Streptomyces sp. NPDC048664]|uniref:ornithine carbamoyltransferase n=1 Tax=Streptomyces sp. NPDC048664 TaxID=3154505 RepID=UPI0034318845
MFHLLKDDDLTPEQMTRVLRVAADDAPAERALAGRSVLLVFLERSTRTRVSLEVAVSGMGGSPVLLDNLRSRLADGETLADTGRVMAQYVDLAFIRAYQQDVDAFAEGFGKITVSAGSDLWHPTQILADLLTLQQEFGDLRGLPVSYVGDGNDICNSVMLGCCALGLRVRVATPPDHRPAGFAIERARRACERSGGELELFTDPVKAVAGTKAVYTDVWRSMVPDDEHERTERFAEFGAYQVDEKLFGHAAPDAVFMHCLPARRDEEVTSSLLDSPRSVVLRQARNRLLVNRALLRLLPDFARGD